MEGPVTPECPASVLQLHPRVTVVVDEGRRDWCRKAVLVCGRMAERT